MSFRLRQAFIVLLALASFAPARAEPEKHYALSLIRPPKYPADFQQFDYVNVNAPKGGTAKLSWPVTYDNLNAAVFRGHLAPGLNLQGATPIIEDTLMLRSEEEAGTQYCLICEWVSYPADFGSVTFKLRDSAKWHDGQPITVEDVIYSMEVAKGKDPGTGLPYEPALAQYYHNVVKGEKTGEREVTFTFDMKGNRELPLIVGELTVFPKHYWTGTDANGKPRDITKSTLEPPLGSGPYKIAAIKPGDWIAYERVLDYWGKDLPLRRGQNNFDRIEFQFYGDRTVAHEAFKAGEYDFKVERSSKDWATGYDFPAAKDGRVIKKAVILERPKPMQGFVFNLRRPKFQDIRVRRAFDLAYDFEWANQNLYYNQYARPSSFFQGGELAAKGLPSPEELALLEPFRDKVPPEVFTQEYKNLVNNTPNEFRNHLREAARLLSEAGYTVAGNQLKNSSGEVFSVEFLIGDQVLQRIILPYADNLKRLGIDAVVRVVDSTEEKRRLDNFDFDITVHVLPQSESPGNEQRDFWSSAAADEPGSRNVMGIKNPAVDALVEKIIFAPNRDALVTACRALDRVLLWSAYLVPNVYLPSEWIAYWNKFGAPNTPPKLQVGFPDLWWFDADLAAKNGLK